MCYQSALSMCANVDNPMLADVKQMMIIGESVIEYVCGQHIEGMIVLQWILSGVACRSLVTCWSVLVNGLPCSTVWRLRSHGKVVAFIIASSMYAGTQWAMAPS